MVLEAHTDDIAAYIIHQLSLDTVVKMSEDFKLQIVQEITSASQKMFLLPAL
jgi:hypothetical protein